MVLLQNQTDLKKKLSVNFLNDVVLHIYTS